jgi:hypothetical protein
VAAPQSYGFTDCVLLWSWPAKITDYKGFNYRSTVSQAKTEKTRKFCGWRRAWTRPVEMEKAGVTRLYFYCAAAGGHFLQMDGDSCVSQVPKAGSGTRDLFGLVRLGGSRKQGNWQGLGHFRKLCRPGLH